MQVFPTLHHRSGNEVEPLPLGYYLPIVGNANASLCKHAYELYIEAATNTPERYKGDGFGALMHALSVVYMAGRIEAIRAIRAERRR